MLFSVLQLFISVRMEKYYTFKGPSLENRLSCLFQTVGHILERRQKQWNITVKRNRSNTESDLVFHFIEEQLAQSPSNDRMKDLTTTKASRTNRCLLEIELAKTTASKTNSGRARSSNSREETHLFHSPLLNTQFNHLLLNSAV